MNSPDDQLGGRLHLRARVGLDDRNLRREAIAIVRLDQPARYRIRQRALSLAAAARRGSLSDGFALSLVHRFGLDTPHGIALMQLAEALPRTADAATAHALIADKIGSLSWRDAVGARPSFAQRVALHALDTLSKIFREPRTDSTLQRSARRMLEKAIDELGSQYVLGESLLKASAKSRTFARKGYRFSYDMLGEAAMTDAAALGFHRNYLQAVASLAKGHSDGAAISVKLSALHPRFDDRQRENCLPLLIERATGIAVRARAAGIPVTIDAEETDRLEITLDVFEALLQVPELRGWNGIGIAVQAYQRRALAVIEWLRARAAEHSYRVNVRLVKGAYWDTEIKHAQQLGVDGYPILLRKRDTDIHYLACARRLLEQPTFFFAQFATHNAHTVAAVAELAQQLGNSNFEFQRLHGMGSHLHDQLLRDGFASRIYAPIGPQRELLPYLVRRLLENGASSSFVRQLTDTSLPIEAVVQDPLAADDIAHTPIGDPTDVHGQSWPSASGYDLAARDSTAALLTLLRVDSPPICVASIIAGRECTSTAAPRAVINPANNAHIVGYAADADADEVRTAVQTAHASHSEWSSLAPGARAAILERAAESLEKRAPQFIRLAVQEAGKTLDDSIGEVREAVDFCRYYAEQCRLPNKQSRHSLGVVACISPWNFPLAIFLGQVTGALAAGNAVVAKPAEQTPLIATLATRLLHDAGVPTSVLQLVLGDGRVGGALIGCAEIAGVCFTGSTVTAKLIGKSLAELGRAALPFIAETGGINAMIVDSSSLPEQAVRDVLTSAFQSAGQRCSALRILCLQEDIADRVLSMLKGALNELRVGDPSLLDTDIGPLIDAEAQQIVRTYLDGQTPVAQAPLAREIATRGSFVAPTIVAVASISDVKREVFGPVLHVARFAADRLDDVLHEINSLGYGLTLGVHTRIRRRVQQVVDTADVGNIYVNRHQVGAVVAQQPFGGHALSGTGPKAGGPHYLLRLSRNAASAPSGGAVIFSDRAIDNHLPALLDRMHGAQAQWERTMRRSEVVRFACQLLAANTAHPLSEMAEHLRFPGSNDLRIQLPSIAGEENVLHLKPRGVLLCLAAPETPCEMSAAQVVFSVAVGNGVLLAVRREQALLVRELIALLRQSGVPEELMMCIEQPDDTIPNEWLGLNINGVVFDGSERDRHEIARRLWRRPGAIVPILSSTDDPYRFCVEQTVTINSAAAGGDPKLLALSG